MKNILLLLPLIFLSACAKEEITSVNQEFAPYLTRFQYLGSQMGTNVDFRNIIIVFDDSLNGTRTLGTCRSGGMSSPLISINTQYWKSASVNNSSREQLMFHELGHCLLDRGHLETTQRAADSYNYIPVSMMNPYHLGSQLYEGNYSQYITELFRRTTPSALYAYAPSDFPATVYASTMSASVEYKVQAKGFSDSEVLTDEDYADVTGFGCGEDHSHEE